MKLTNLIPAMGLFAATLTLAQSLSFEVATIKPATPDDRSGRFATMRSAHQWEARNYSIRYLASYAYDLPLPLISGGPDWINTELYNIVASTPGDNRSSVDDQMSMARQLLTDRFKFSFHREKKEMAVYTLTVLKTGAKLTESTAPADVSPTLVNVVYPAEKIRIPARNATMAQFASLMQRSVFNRPVVDKTELKGRYDFDLEWTYDDSQFGGNLPPIAENNAPKVDLFAALQQLGLKLESGRGMVDVLIVDQVERPTQN